MSDTFSDWLASELQKRNWSHNELARQSGLSQPTISAVMSNAKRPGLKFCLQVAQALDVSPVLVLQLAGHLPEDSPLVLEIIEIVRSLPPDKHQALLHYLRYHFGTEPADAILREAIDLLNALPPDKRREALNYLRYLKGAKS